MILEHFYSIVHLGFYTELLLIYLQHVGFLYRTVAYLPAACYIIFTNTCNSAGKIRIDNKCDCDNYNKSPIRCNPINHDYCTWLFIKWGNQSRNCFVKWGNQFHCCLRRYECNWVYDFIFQISCIQNHLMIRNKI